MGLKLDVMSPDRCSILSPERSSIMRLIWRSHSFCSILLHYGYSPSVESAKKSLQSSIGSQKSHDLASHQPCYLTNASLNVTYSTSFEDPVESCSQEKTSILLQWRHWDPPQTQGRQLKRGLTHWKMLCTGSEAERTIKTSCCNRPSRLERKVVTLSMKILGSCMQTC